MLSRKQRHILIKFLSMFSVIRGYNILVVLILLSFRINLAAFLLALGLFSAIAYLLDPVFHNVGLSLLQNESLQATWVAMFNSVFLHIQHFNNTLLIRGLAISLLAFCPLILILNILLKQYRNHFHTFLNLFLMFISLHIFFLIDLIISFICSCMLV